MSKRRGNPARATCQSGKRIFTTERAALVAAAERSVKIGIPLYVYQCRLCHWWHRTRQCRPVKVSLAEFAAFVINELAWEQQGHGQIVCGIRGDATGVQRFIEYRADVPVTAT